MDDNTATTAIRIPWDEACTLQSFTIALDDDPACLIHPQDPINVRASLLIRPTTSGSCHQPGLYVHHYCDSPDVSKDDKDATRRHPNVRATRLAMTCGLFQLRLYDDVIVTRGLGSGNKWSPLVLDDVSGACCVSPDLRFTPKLPVWLGNATRNNYHDTVALTLLTKAMNRPEHTSDEDSELSFDTGVIESPIDTSPTTGNGAALKEAVTTVSLCLHCRRPASQLCPECQGAYFCNPPATCRVDGWSHRCLCPAWKMYTERRSELSTLPFDDSGWYTRLMGREFQTSETPYEEYLVSRLGVSKDFSSWWRTEMDGWSGGESDSTRAIDVWVRVSYVDGFCPVVGIPIERRVRANDISEATLTVNEVGLLRLTCWQDYYRLRRIPYDSPCALLLTFPLSLYYSIVEFGQVPCTVAHTILKRPLRVHIVGAEKEVNFIDMFKEVSFLLTDNFELELVFVVHHDMRPPSLRLSEAAQQTALGDLTPTLKVWIASGSYGDTLDPNFDCGSGPPDMIVAFNAGLFAYESWRSVLTYLDDHRGVVGVFTDYNEFSAVQCASLGGMKSRQSAAVNPFRQPRAMPVYCMNLPQFSNGFVYVLNGQSLDG